MGLGLNRIASGVFTENTFNDNALAAETATVNQHGIGVLAGLAMTAGSGLTINVSSGVVQGSKAASIPSFSGTAPDNATRYVWLDYTRVSTDLSGNAVYEGSLTFTATLAQPGGNLACLGIVVTASGAISSISPTGRMVLDRWTGLQSYEIGDTIAIDAATGNLVSDGQVQAYGGFGSASIDVTSGNVTLNAAQASCFVLLVAGTPGTSRNVVAPALTGKPFAVVNGSNSAIVVKTPGGTGVTIASAKSAFVVGDGTNVVRLTADA